MKIKQVPAHTNNYGKGRGNYKINQIIIHWINGTLKSCDATFQNPERLASAHFGIANDEIHQYVSEEDTAWHCGNLTINKQSIGIEHEGSPTIPISEETYKTSATLVKSLCLEYNIPIDRQHIRGHKEIKATQCPGTFDIDKLINLINNDDMNYDQTKTLEIIEAYRISNKHSNLEGAASAAVGAANEIEQIKADLKVNQKLLDSCQSNLKTANEISGIDHIILGLKLLFKKSQ